jgi:hypothetical protein
MVNRLLRRIGGGKPASERSLRSNLIIFAAAILLPMLAVAAITSAFMARRERARYVQGVTEHATALLSAFDTELRSSVRVLSGLATSRSLDNGDLRSFYAEASRVAASQSDWLTVILLDTAGQQLLNLLRPFGGELPAALDRQSFEEVIRFSRPVIGSLVQSKFVAGRGFAVRVPVARNGITKYVLTAGVNPKAMLSLLTSQPLPAGWSRRFWTATGTSWRAPASMNAISASLLVKIFGRH